MADPLDLDAIEQILLCNADIPCGRLKMGQVWQDINALALVAELRQARRLLTRALPHIDPNDNHDTYELMLAIEEATR